MQQKLIQFMAGDVAASSGFFLCFIGLFHRRYFYG